MVALLEAFTPDETDTVAEKRVGGFFLREGDRVGKNSCSTLIVVGKNDPWIYDECRAASSTQRGDWTREDGIASVFAKNVYNVEGGFAEHGIPYDPTDGFAARITEYEGHYYIAFRGTTFTSLEDWINNAQQGVGLPASQYNQARQLAADVALTLDPGTFTFVGHSLGGGLASAAAYAGNAGAITFNAAGLHSRYQNGSPGNIRAHYIRGDVLSSFQDNSPIFGSAVGTRIMHQPRAWWNGPVSRHLMDQF